MDRPRPTPRWRVPERMALEPLEDARLDLGRDAAALILDLEDHLAAALAGRDRDGLAGRARSRPRWRAG